MGLMFYLAKLYKIFKIEPKDLNHCLKKNLEEKVVTEVENTCDEKIGYIISVNSFSKFSKGKVEFGTGAVIYKVKFKCLVCKPKVGEVINVIVDKVLQDILFASAGPIKIVINQKNFDEDNSFFLENRNGIKTLVSRVHNTIIAPDTELRVKILGLNITKEEKRETFLCTGTISGNYLGLFKN